MNGSQAETVAEQMVASGRFHAVQRIDAYLPIRQTVVRAQRNEGGPPLVIHKISQWHAIQDVWSFEAAEASP